MSPNRITRSSSLLETLRALAHQRSSETSRQSSTDQTQESRAQELPANQHDVQALRQQLRDVAAAIDPSDAQSALRAREAALRDILLWEFGSEFRNDPQFLPMIEAIGKTLDGNPEFQQQFTDLMTELRKS
jgi:hypothetical protein